MTQPVLWMGCIERMLAEGFDRFIEVGPGRVLTGLMRKIDRSVAASNVGKLADLEAELVASGAH
ncbi:MAG: ACP S-malonyltransferase [Planctomycetes bacterium]|nr:ACP S-malonyltransferase [Planctomycetota bacterium]